MSYDCNRLHPPTHNVFAYGASTASPIWFPQELNLPIFINLQVEMALHYVIIFDGRIHKFGHVEGGFFVVNAIARANSGRIIYPGSSRSISFVVA